MISNHTKIEARLLVTQAIESGSIPKASDVKCKRCGKQAYHYHHNDYTKPLDITPLCRKCHVIVHTELNKQRFKELQDKKPDIKFMNATEFNLMTGIFRYLKILRKYQSIIVVRHGKPVLEIKLPKGSGDILEQWGLKQERR